MMSYLSSRFPSLLPTYDAAPNPFRLLRSLTFEQWIFFFVGFFAWTFDALDFHTVTQTYAELAATFQKSTADISIGVTLVLGLRPVGGAIFGTAADFYGRKWPLVCNLSLLIILELSTSFCQTYTQFLAARALFGVAMGGIYGNAAATALEDCHEEARGLLSGIYQSGYTFGYLLAVVFWKAFEGTQYGWRSLFQLSAALPVLLIIVRVFLPETKAYRDRVHYRGERAGLRVVVAEAKVALKRHWLLLIYLVFLMAGFSFMSHGSQDLYALMLQYKYDYPNRDVTIVLVVSNIGAILGGVTMGHCSQIFGRRFCIVVLCIAGAALMYPYTLTSGPGIYAAAFFEQFCVQGAFGIIPIHLLELSPVAFRTFVVGTSYQLGVLIASASNTIETRLGERYPLPSKDVDGEVTAIYDYSLVICIFMACTFTYVVIVTIIGPERRKRSMTIQEDDDDDGDWNVELRHM